MYLNEVLHSFGLEGSATPYGSGHINDTFRVITKSGGFILQRVNTNVFKNPAALMRNISLVSEYLRKLGRMTLTVVKTAGGGDYLEHESGFWRVFEFIKDSIFLDSVENRDDFIECGRAFGAFQRDLAGFDASLLAETIPRFHDTPDRYAQLKEAIRLDARNRVKDVADEINFALSRETYAATLMNALNSGELPLRVTHNDTKLNNVLFSSERKALCVVDLDTVMPGLSAADFGDAIRFGASIAKEDEQDLAKVEMSLELFEAFAEGYLSACSLTEKEVEMLADGAVIITLECGARFLTDYLNGDVYFKTERGGHNLDRCRAQFKLAADMEGKRADMEGIVKRFYNRPLA